ncbi:unnamed protein product [Paramecium sonneborni]|uniref:Uncharacterized protein n=1 Tax=Paramecium sonneborni TaxID=65129 RepID=A0A8S1N2X9_9CILI|nr:unnamed protein product [Paramecium sonneborni]
MKLCERLCRSQTNRREINGLVAIFKPLQVVKTLITSPFTCYTKSKRNYQHNQITQRSICRHLIATSQCSIKVFESLSSCL